MTTTQTHQVQLSGKTVTIRPIAVDDVVLEKEFIEALSPQTRHYRFLGGVGKLSDAQLKKLCEVDGTATMAFIATIKEHGKEKEIGVSRYAPTDASGVSELALTVADEWQDRGLGEVLLSHLFEYAKTHNIQQLYSIESADNEAMHHLAHALAMEVHTDPHDIHQVVYKKSL